jgi:hypothetical protein
LRRRYMHKNVRKIVKEVEEHGFSTELTPNGHLKIRNGGGGLVCTIGARVGRGRGEANLRAELKRRGVLA